MATSGHVDVQATTYDILRFNWSRSSVSIAENYSIVDWNMQLISASYGAISSSTSKNWSVTVNGETTNGSNSISIGNNTSKVLASGSTRIYHNNDGTKAFAFSFSQVFNINFNGYVGTVSGSGSSTLDTIPRTSSVSADSANIGNTITVSISRASDTFTHTLRYGFGNLSGTIVDKTSSTSCRWTTPDSFYTQIPNAKSGRGTIWCDTYSGSTLIGTSACTFDVSTDETVCKPVLTPTVINQDTVSSTVTGDANAIIKSHNEVQVSFNASGQKSATISAMNVTCGGKSLTGDGLLTDVDSGTFIFTVTDSRGYSTTSTISKTLIDYIPLTCNLSTDPDLVEGSTTNVNIAVKGRYFEGSFGAVNNTLIIEYRYRINDGNYPTDADGNEVWTELTYVISDGGYTAKGSVTELNYTNSYTFQARAKDAIYTNGVTTVEQTVRIVPTFDWSEKDFNFNVPVHSKGGFTEDIAVLDNGDCNTICVSGRFYIGTNGTNKPVSGVNGWLTVQSYGSSHCYQEYVTSSGIKYYRMQDENGWGVWILTDGGYCEKLIHTTPWSTISASNSEDRTYRRFGNIVFMDYVAIYEAGAKYFQLNEQIIPNGYRPVSKVRVTYAQLVSHVVYGTARWTASPDGTSYCELTHTGISEHMFTTSWITNDAFPVE